MSGRTLLMLSLSIIGATCEHTDSPKPEALLFSLFKGNATLRKLRYSSIFDLFEFINSAKYRVFCLLLA